MSCVKRELLFNGTPTLIPLLREGTAEGNPKKLVVDLVFYAKSGFSKENSFDFYTPV